MGTEAPTVDLVHALVASEGAVSEAIFVTETLAALLPAAAVDRVRRATSASTAIGAATALARQGKRASAILEPKELLSCVDPIAVAAAERAPITVHVVSSDSAGPAIARPGRSELAAALELGAGVLVSWGAEDALDTALIARRAAEDSETPFIHFVDCPAGATALALRDNAEIARFIGLLRPASRTLDRGDSAALKRSERSFSARAPFALGSAARDLKDLTGRSIAPLERQDTLDAEEIIVALGAAVPPALALARTLRASGRKIGVLAVRALRPFSAIDAVKAVARARAIVVMEPLDVALAPCGPLASALKVAFADALTWAPGFPGVGRIPPIVSAGFATVTGAIREQDVEAAMAEMASGDRARRHLTFGSEG